MKKTHYRDYAVSAFRFYAETGGIEQYKKAICQMALDGSRKAGGRANGISKPTEAALITAENRLEAAKAEIMDLEAVQKTIETIKGSKDGQKMIQALSAVYMQGEGTPRKKDIEYRVHSAEIKLCVGEATIYRWLEYSRLIFARERGLRT